MSNCRLSVNSLEAVKVFTRGAPLRQIQVTLVQPNSLM